MANVIEAAINLRNCVITLSPMNSGELLRGAPIS